MDEARAIMMTTWELVAPAICENTLNDLHEALHQRFSLEIYTAEHSVYLCFSAPDSVADVLVGAFYTMLSGSSLGAAEIHEIPAVNKQKIPEVHPGIL